VSHETIYRSPIHQARGVLKKELLTNCGRSGACAARAMPVPADSHEDRSSRPSPSVNDLRMWKTERFRPLGGGSAGRGQELHLHSTLVERHSRFAMLIKVPSKNTEVVVAALSRRYANSPLPCDASLTWDRDWRWPSTKTSR